jgi:beta-mannosidase
MKSQSLSGKWQFRQVGTEEWLNATVPGCVHTDLLNLGLIPDPFIGDNEKKVMWVSESDWEYRFRFIPSNDIINEEKFFLNADGLDTLAEVSLNNVFLGITNNQFRNWRWEIAEFFHEGENTLDILFKSPAKYVSTEQKRRRMKGVSQAIEGASHIRKAPCQFGWDWGPKLPSMGIWKDIRLEGYSVAKIKETHIRQFLENDSIIIQVNVLIDQWQNGKLNAILRIEHPDGTINKTTKVFADDQISLQVKINSPYLWWPNGYGEQPLYEVEVLLLDSDRVLDKQTSQIGLRTINLVRNKDKYGESFQFIVNNVPIFIKGSNWIPADTFITRFSDQHLETLIVDAAAGHQNMLRVWGGGFYEEERFYDLCDRYGILIWQDFIFSCSIYPLDETDFFENVKIEIFENIRRLRHRTCLALWCGNNEMEEGWESWGWQKHPLEDQALDFIEQFPTLRFILDSIGDRDLLPDWEMLKDEYDRFFHETLPAWVKVIDPDTAYWPSSPSSNTPFHKANGEDQGDAHFWDVWHGRKPFTAYRESYPRFMSEFGFQAFPTYETIESYTNPEDRNLTSYVMEHHQRGNHGNGLIIAQMTDLFRMPVDFYGWIYLSMVLQAEGIRYGVEHWRRNMHRVSGTLYWQLNDCWPVASWSSIDYFGRWKALHYASKKFYAPLLLSIEDNPPRIDIHITSDLTISTDCIVTWSLEELSGKSFASGTLNATAKPLSNNFIHSLNFQDIVNEVNKRKLILVCELSQDTIHISTCIGTFVPNKHIAFTDPHINVEIKKKGKQCSLTLTTESLARFVELKLDGTDVVFSDNYFDIPARRKKEVTFPYPSGWSLEKTTKALRVYSLNDSY